MNTVTELRTPSKILPTFPPIRQHPTRALLARAVTLLFMVAGIANLAGAQSLGFVVNSTDGTVTVFGNVTTTLDAQAFSEDTLQTVTFPTQTGQSAPGLVATAVAPAAGSKIPPTRLVYVTDQQNSELWAFDVSTISQGNAAAKPVSIAAGSCSPLFSQPGAIVIATPGSSMFAYVVNQGDGTVSIIDLAAASCVAKTAALGTITGIAASPDMNEVFVITATVGAPPALWAIDTTATPQTAVGINVAAIKLVDPVSIAVQNDSAACYFIAIGDKGNSMLFLAAVGPLPGNADPNCPVGVTPTTAELVDPQTPITLAGLNPVGLVSTFAPGTTPGNIYIADAGNNEVWELDCSVSDVVPDYVCFVPETSPVTLTGAVPTTIGISLAQTIGAATAAVTHQYLYVAGTAISSVGSVFDYSDVGVNGGSLFSFSTSAIPLGNGPQGLIFSGADPNDPPVTWFISASGGNGNFSGTTWVMPVTGLLTALGGTVVNLQSAAPPTLSLNFGTTAVNGLFPSTTIFCAPFGGGTGETSCPGDDGVQGANAVGGQSSSTSGGQAGSLNLPASTVFTVTLESCSEATCPASPNPATDTLLTQQISAGAVCTLAVTTPPPTNTGLDNVAIGQALDAQITCVAPAGGQPIVGDGISATITWAPGVTGTVSCTAQTCTLSNAVNGYQYENATMPFASNSYSAAGAYPITILGTDTTENVPIYFTGALPTVTVNGPSITVSPTGTAGQPLQVQLLGTQAFTGVLSYSASTPTVTWALTSGGSSCSPGCGTISDTQATLISGTLNYNISATYTAPAAVFAGTVTLTVSASGASTQAFIAVKGPAIAVSPTGTAGQPLPVQLLGTQAFSGTLDFSPASPTVTWALTAGGTACSNCGTISNTQATQIAGTTDYNISATYTAPAAVFNGTITLTVSADGVSTQAFIETTTSTTIPPPSCSFSAPPTAGQTGLAVTVTLSCIAPANDSLSATVDFSDGTTPTTMTGTAAGGTATLTFTHTYVNTGTYSLSITSIADTTSGLFGTPPAAVPIVVYLTPTVTPAQSSVPLAPGQSATFGVSFAGGLADANITFTNFACQGLPTGATCTFSPASITLDANGNSTDALQVTVTLAASSSSRMVPPNGPQQIVLVASLWGLPLFGLLFLGTSSGRKGRKHRRAAGFGLLLVLLLMLMWIPACSSVTQSNLVCSSCATPGSYPITVTGGSVNPELQSTTVFTLVVEP